MYWGHYPSQGVAAAATDYEEEVGRGTGRTSTDHACTGDHAGMQKYLVCLLVCASQSSTLWVVVANLAWDLTFHSK